MWKQINLDRQLICWLDCNKIEEEIRVVLLIGIKAKFIVPRNSPPGKPYLKEDTHQTNRTKVKEQNSKDSNYLRIRSQKPNQFS